MAAACPSTWRDVPARTVVLQPTDQRLRMGFTMLAFHTDSGAEPASFSGTFHAALTDGPDRTAR